VAYRAQHAVAVTHSTATSKIDPQVLMITSLSFLTLLTFFLGPPSASSPPLDFDVLDADFVVDDDFRLFLLGRSSSLL
jgi:hypothetical protein